MAGIIGLKYFSLFIYFFNFECFPSVGTWFLIHGLDSEHTFNLVSFRYHMGGNLGAVKQVPVPWDRLTLVRIEFYTYCVISNKVLNSSFY